MPGACRSTLVITSLLGACLACRQSLGQSVEPAIFVANNGNLEGSVTSYIVNADGSLTWRDKLVTGVAPVGGNDPGTNCQALSLSPNGMYIAVGHGTISSLFEQLTILSVATDGTLAPFAVFQTPDTPIDVEWVTDQYLAVTATPASNDFVVIYDFDPKVPSLAQAYYSVSGTTTYYLCVDRDRQRIYASNSAGVYSVYGFQLNGDGTLTSLGSYPSGIYPLGIGLSPDGSRLYFGGGISSDDHRVGGFSIDVEAGAMTLMPNSPYLSEGDSPKQVVVSGDGAFAFASHGGDATVRGFAIDPKTGELSSTGVIFDVGGQGDAGNMAVMDTLLFVTDRYTSGDGVRGTYSFTINADGTLTQNGPLVDSQGMSPWDIAVWPGLPAECPADLSGDQNVDITDLLEVISGWGTCDPPCPADLNGDGAVDVDDLLIVINAWGACR
jgi:hypothetical protein